METQVTETPTNHPAVEVKKLQQKEAVYKFFCEVLGTSEGLVAEDLKKNKDVKKAVKEKLLAGIKNGEIVMKDKGPSYNYNKYCSGLISHWLKRDTRYVK